MDLCWILISTDIKSTNPFMAVEGCLFSFMQFVFAPDVPLLLRVTGFLSATGRQRVCRSLFMPGYFLFGPQQKVLGAAWRHWWVVVGKAAMNGQCHCCPLLPCYTHWGSSRGKNGCSIPVKQGKVNCGIAFIYLVLFVIANCVSYPLLNQTGQLLLW